MSKSFAHTCCQTCGIEPTLVTGETFFFPCSCASIKYRRRGKNFSGALIEKKIQLDKQHTLDLIKNEKDHLEGE